MRTRAIGLLAPENLVAPRFGLRLIVMYIVRHVLFRSMPDESMNLMRALTLRISQAIILLCLSVPALHAEQVSIGDRKFSIPDGFELELVTTPELTQRPIVVDFDERGNLYVAESSGTNDNVNIQLEEKPHSILRLTDSDGDGKFDRRTVFADRMMFPEGTMWHDGSLYVGAPPQIWKLTDTDDDGVADEREIWFDAKTLTGCANDLHGPYLGPDGWIYWCKGAFAEQSYTLASGARFETRAAHIFRRRPEGGPVEPVMTGGMDNPVEVVFTPGGERIFTTTFFQHPKNGQRDGLVHAVYGGVYGKSHGVIDGHPRTGELMPVLTHLGAAAPSGLARLKSNSLGFENQIVSACFNLHSVMRHQLRPSGATFETEDNVLVESDDLDFHPTDVIEDADGSLLVVDTGGWYKLCCPTSQLHKPDVFGAIYRLRKSEGGLIDDPRGQRIKWDTLSPTDLSRQLADSRPVIQARAISELASRLNAAIAPLRSTVRDAASRQARINAIWCACRIDSQAARSVVRLGLDDPDELVRQVAVHAVSVWRDKETLPRLTELLKSDSESLRRVAAEAIGRIGDASALPHLLNALRGDCDRVLEHSMIYAIIETNAPEHTRFALASDSLPVRRAAVRALSEMDNSQIDKDLLVELLVDEDSSIRKVATEIARQHPEWGDSYRHVFESRRFIDPISQGTQIAALANSPAVREGVVTVLKSDSPSELKVILLESLDPNLFGREEWDLVIANALSESKSKSNLVASAVRSLTKRGGKQLDGAIRERLAEVSRVSTLDADVRLSAIQSLGEVDDEMLQVVIGFLQRGQPAVLRGRAATTLASLRLNGKQLLLLADAMREVAPLEINRVLDCFEDHSDEQIGLRLFRALVESPAASAIPPQRLAKSAARFGPAVSKYSTTLLAANDTDPIKQAGRLEAMLTTLPSGDIRRGQRIFHSDQAACFACHAVGYRGGTIGPDLSNVARIRSKRDLLEAIIFPSASFVRSYEPVTIVSKDGRQFSGNIRDRNSERVLLQTNATEQQTIRVEDIDELVPGAVSVMPAGLEKQLTDQELADLLAFLLSRK